MARDETKPVFRTIVRAPSINYFELANAARNKAHEVI